MGCGKGIPRSEEHKKKIGLSNKGKNTGKTSPFLGCTHSDTSRKKMSDANKKNEKCKNHIQEMNRAKKDVPLTDNHKKKLSDALRGKSKTEEHKRKISDAHKGKRMLCMSGLNNPNASIGLKALKFLKL